MELFVYMHNLFSLDNITRLTRGDKHFLYSLDLQGSL